MIGLPEVGEVVHRTAAAATRLSAGLREKTVLVDGVTVTYDERTAAGTPVLMLHGFSADREVWSRFAAALRGRPVVIPDQLGHGATPFVWGADYSAPAQARRILALADVLEIDRFHVIGNSMGGFIAAHLAALAPRRTVTAALIDPAGVTSPIPSKLDLMRAAGNNPFLMDDIRAFDDFYAMTMARPPFVPGFVRRSIAAGYVARRDRLEKIYEGFSGRDLFDHGLSAITSPTWIAWGRNDQLIDISAAQLWADGIPDSQLTVYEELGHMPMLEAPGRTAQDYAAFLHDVERPPE